MVFGVEKFESIKSCLYICGFFFFENASEFFIGGMIVKGCMSTHVAPQLCRGKRA